jgi:hypothetical protein
MVIRLFLLEWCGKVPHYGSHNYIGRILSLLSIFVLFGLVLEEVNEVIKVADNVSNIRIVSLNDNSSVIVYASPQTHVPSFPPISVCVSSFCARLPPLRRGCGILQFRISCFARY